MGVELQFHGFLFLRRCGREFGSNSWQRHSGICRSKKDAADDFKIKSKIAELQANARDALIREKCQSWGEQNDATNSTKLGRVHTKRIISKMRVNAMNSHKYPI